VSEVRRKLTCPTGLGSQWALVRLPRLIVEGELGWARWLGAGPPLRTGGEIYNHRSSSEVLAPRAARAEQKQKYAKANPQIVVISNDRKTRLISSPQTIASISMQFQPNEASHSF